MGDMAGLPALSDPRLIVLQKQSKRVRKGVTIQNDKLKFHREKYGRLTDKHKAADEYRRWQQSMPFKHSLTEIRGLQKCLRKRRESSTLEPELTPRNGVYDGASLDSMKYEVDALIKEKNPRERRMRKVERIKNNGFRDGRIVDYDTSMSKFGEVLSRPRGIMRGERPMSAQNLADHSPRSSLAQSPYSPAPDSPPQFRLPPIQARRSTLANTSLVTRPSRSLFSDKSDRSDAVVRSMKRSMSFAVAR